MKWSFEPVKDLCGENSGQDARRISTEGFRRACRRNVLRPPHGKSHIRCDAKKQSFSRLTQNPFAELGRE